MKQVILVGAGPGDPELLTIKALRVLREADVILFDDLVSRQILEVIGPGPTAIGVGKRAGRPSWAQGDINELMIRLAREGRQVVRLKSGDPSVFGRSGEEIAALTAAGVGVTVVPGITTASALAASLNVSLTHRACAQSLRFVTAHGAKGTLPPDLDWSGLAHETTTLIVYMGGRTGGELAQKLIEHGRPGTTSVVVVKDVSRDTQKSVAGRLVDLDRLLVACDGNGPVTIAIGKVFEGLNVGNRGVDCEIAGNRIVAS
ncbi:uroporphyrinogen-III C-methyltransferase [Parvibaculaceae bacterium PLY_AMNH_Bact1]|nr:uroporphyrinogen-III C-methyltransferase [Parvibaculaceae bacterium PLY_AMNH_Bact1]